jgi:Flp pilus assembly protein TadG
VTKRTPFTKCLNVFGPGKKLAGLWKKHGRRGECGSELLEFAICANVFFLFCFGFLELCVALFSLHSVSEASRQSARWASVRGTASSVTSNGTTSCGNPNISTCPATATDIQTFAQSQPGMASSNTQVTVNWCNGDGTTGCTTSETNAIPGHIVKVTVTYTFARIPYVSSGAITLSNTAEKVIWQ